MKYFIPISFIICQFLYTINMIIISVGHRKIKKIISSIFHRNKYLIGVYRDMLISGYIFLFLFIVFGSIISIFNYFTYREFPKIKILDKYFDKCLKNTCEVLENDNEKKESLIKILKNKIEHLKNRINKYKTILNDEKAKNYEKTKEEELRNKKEEEEELRKQKEEELERQKEEELKRKKEEELKRKKEEELKKQKEERIRKKHEILERQSRLRKEHIINKTYNNKIREEKIKNLLEDMCVFGNIMKEEIIEEKKKEPEKFISIEEATNEENKDNSEFCLGLLA